MSGPTAPRSKLELWEHPIILRTSGARAEAVAGGRE